MNLHDTKTKSIIIKLMFFFSFTAFSSWLSYFNVYLKEVPMLSGFEIGIIAAIQQFNSLFVLPIWGLLADKFGRKKMLVLSLFLSSACLLIFTIQTTFIFYILFIILLTSVYNPLSPLFDSIGLDFEEESGKTSYGELRLWGSIGWAISSVVTGQIINSGNISYIFPIASTLLFFTAFISLAIYRPLKVQRKIEVAGISHIRKLLQNDRSLLNFYILIFLYALLASPTYLFINMYYNEIGATNSQIGIAYGVQAICELPFFFYGKRIVKRWGAKPIFIAVLLITSARMIFYGLNSNPWWAVGMGIFQGFSIAMFLVSAVEFVHNLIPSKLRSTGQSLIYTFFSVGICFGNLFAGYLKDIISIRNAMIINAVFLFGLIVALTLRRQKQIKAGK